MQVTRESQNCDNSKFENISLASTNRKVAIAPSIPDKVELKVKNIKSLIKDISHG